MKRRSFIKQVSAGAMGIAAAGMAAPASGQGLREWRMVTAWPADFPGLGTGARRLADRITAMSGGRLTVRVFAAGELAPALGTSDAVARGDAEMGHAPSYYYSVKNPAVNFFTAVPFGMIVNEHNAWIRHGGGQQLWDELYADFGLKPFLCGNSGTQMGGWFKNEIRSVDDLRGLNFRTAGLGEDVFKRLGANVLSLPGDQIFAALENGSLDAAEWAGPWNDLALGLYRVASHYYWPSPSEPSAALECVVNRRAWEDLPADLKAIVENAAAAENDAVPAEFAARNAEAIEILVQQHGVQLREFSRDVQTEFARAAAEVNADLRSEGGIAQRIHDSYMAFQRRALTVTRVGEQGYLNTRLLSSGSDS